MVVNQGDVFWVDFDDPNGSEPRHTHPSVVIQNNLYNHSQISSVIVCSLTSNVKRAKVPGNVLLEQDEANLPKQSVVLVSQIYTVDKLQLREFIGTLSKRRMRQILDGVRLMTEPHDAPK
ncbi:MAG: PemK family transcriptional regulator [Chloroflexi bacterium UTCFX4]|jgi:mRNA interferase MazF|nr:MAG: PemK family transcriptional regulator [Chloroflexi bacterium UTCFX4]